MAVVMSQYYKFMNECAEIDLNDLKDVLLIIKRYFKDSNYSDLD
ncbi:hypothetical protein [Clostridium chromiireducens]|nr:hypothetical protein [Clostridium chromiireducens]